MSDFILQMLQNPPDPNEPLPMPNRPATIIGTTVPFLVRNVSYSSNHIAKPKSGYFVGHGHLPSLRPPEDCSRCRLGRFTRTHIIGMVSSNVQFSIMMPFANYPKIMNTVATAFVIKGEYPVIYQRSSLS